MKKKREEAADEAAMKKNPDYYRAQMEAQLGARLHMQEKYNQVERNKPAKLG